MSDPQALAAPFLNAQLSAAFAGIALWGMHVTCYLIALKAMLSSRKGVRWLSVAISSALFVIGTLNVTETMRRVIIGFVYSSDRPGGTLGYFLDISNSLCSVYYSTYVLQLIMQPSLLAWRCYVVYNRRFWTPEVLVPILLFVGVAVLAIGADVSLSTAPVGMAVHTSNGLFPRSTIKWAQAATGLEMGANMITTGLIAYGIWRARRASSVVRRHSTGVRMALSQPHAFAMSIVIESGVICLIPSVICFALWSVQSPGFLINAAAHIQVVAINFDLVFIRIQKGISFERDSGDSGRRMSTDPGTSPRSNSSLDSKVSQATHVDSVVMITRDVEKVVSEPGRREQEVQLPQEMV